MRYGFLIVLALMLLIRLPFLDQAIQGDDVYYLAGAQHAQIDPAHPNHGSYVFLGDMVDMRGHPHPPLNAWALAALLALFGDVYEVPFHAAYILFSLIAAASVWSLAKRFTTRPVLATALFLFTPAFVVNGNSFEADVPFLAFWLAAVALAVKAIDRRSWAWLAGFVLASALAAMGAYQAVLLVPVLAVYIWLKDRKWWPAWVALLAAPAALIVWQLYERASSGSVPAGVLFSYFQTYGFQAIAAKASSAAALVAHTGWMLFPLLAVAAFWNRIEGVVALVLAGCAMALDLHPLFWLSFGVGALILIDCARRALKEADADARFLAAWIVLFFAAAVVLFFAGSARYLLPMAAPLALLGARVFDRHPRWAVPVCAVQCAFALALAWVNYQHWDGYRVFASEFRKQSLTGRVWINGEWGLRFYLESEGGLPLVRGQAVRPGDYVVGSRLGFPIPFTTGGGVLAPVMSAGIQPTLPLRLIGLGARSAYSTSSLGLRPFDVSTGPVDEVTAQVVIERQPVAEFLPMNAPEAAQQIVSGIYDLEQSAWRWMGEKAVILLKRPEKPKPVEVTFSIPGPAPARQVSLYVDNELVAQASYETPGTYTLRSLNIEARSPSVTLTIAVDRSFSVPGDHRQLGITLASAGFR
jgi:4-amino-4-deoxy-L-arabinose transferase-like glycosyltransferase